MGLDLMELVLEIEDEFGIYLGDGNWEDRPTVGDLHRIICNQVCFPPEIPPAACLTGAIFRDLRQSLLQVQSVSRTMVRPSKQIADVIGPHGRRRIWHELERVLGARLPGLERPALLINATINVGFALWCATLGLILMQAPWPVLTITAITLPLIWTIWWIATLPFAVVLPRAVSTFGDLTRWLNNTQNGVFVRRFQPHLAEWLDPDEVWTRLRNIVSNELGVPLEQVTPEARFVEDLWVD